VVTSQTFGHTKRYGFHVRTGLKRFQETRDLHFVTFTCYHWKPYLSAAATRDLFEEMLEQTRRAGSPPEPGLLGWVAGCPSLFFE
jgi:hypothetical protein